MIDEKAGSDNDTYVLNQLKAPTRFNFLELLYQVNESDFLDDKTKIILELFTFGDYSHYVKHSSIYPELDLALVEKLVKLSILSIANVSENSTLKIDKIIEDSKYGLKAGLESYLLLSVSAGDEDTWGLLESLLISMVDEKLLDVKIDDETGSLIISKSYVLRDSYNSSHKLWVLTAEDVEEKSVDKALNKLKHWKEEKLDPVCNQFQPNAA